ncbi:GLUT4 regulating protein TUG domain-containing protein [Trichoderma austrokoningii]
MSHVVVINTDLRRTTIKVNPGTYLSDVLAEACNKLGLDSDKYSIKYQQKQVDLSMPFRTSGLLAGAKLELVQKSKSPSVVQIALQFPEPEARAIPGGRMIKKFPSDLSLWQVLRQFESDAASEGYNINITARGVPMKAAGVIGPAKLYYEAPALNIMGRELGTFDDFQRTMSQLGHNSGNVLVRLWFRKTDMSLTQTLQMIKDFFKDDEKKAKEDEKRAQEAKEKAASSVPEDKPNDPPTEDGDVPMTEEAPAESITKAQEEPAVEVATPDPTSSVQSETKNSDAQSSLEPVNVFLAPTTSTPAAALAPVDERDFTPTVAQAQLHQARLLESSRNKRLLSDREIEEKEAAESAKIDAVKSVLVKVRFPDNTSSEWQIGPSDTGAFLYRAVRHVMGNDSQSFHLVAPGSKTVIQDEDSPKHNLIRAYKLSGRVLISLVWNDDVSKEAREQPFLKASFAQQAQAIKVPEMPTAEDDEAGPSAAPQAQKAPAKDGDGKKVPKWLKLGKK